MSNIFILKQKIWNYDFVNDLQDDLFYMKRKKLNLTLNCLDGHTDYTCMVTLLVKMSTGSNFIIRKYQYALFMPHGQIFSKLYKFCLSASLSNLITKYQAMEGQTRNKIQRLHYKKSEKRKWSKFLLLSRKFQNDQKKTQLKLYWSSEKGEGM